MSFARRSLATGALLFLVALAFMRVSTPLGVRAEPIGIEGPGGRPCVGRLWHPADPPKAVILIGHGVSCNQGVMATIAKAFSAEGYAAIAFDFWGHGRAREPFDWRGNPDQVRAWCAWARGAYPGLPLAYLGHSMGGFAAAEAFAGEPLVDAFVSLGALPRQFPDVPTLVAAGRFEELFSPAEARRRAEGRAGVLISPFSNHALETWDPVLVRGMVAWVDTTLGLASLFSYPWWRWLALYAAIAAGVAGAFLLAGGAAATLRGEVREIARPRAERRWSLNPYRVAARFTAVDHARPAERAASLPRALLQALIFSAVLVAALALLLDRDVFTSWPDHPARVLAWLIGAAALWPVFLLDALVLERVPFRGAGQRFQVAALTRAVPVFVVAAVLWLLVPQVAFGAMMLAILAFLAVMLSLVHALVTRAAADPRAGALASAMTLAWVVAFWFPMAW